MAEFGYGIKVSAGGGRFRHSPEFVEDMDEYQIYTINGGDGRPTQEQIEAAVKEYNRKPMILISTRFGEFQGVDRQTSINLTKRSAHISEQMTRRGWHVYDPNSKTHGDDWREKYWDRFCRVMATGGIVLYLTIPGIADGHMQMQEEWPKICEYRRRRQDEYPNDIMFRILRVKLVRQTGYHGFSAYRKQHETPKKGGWHISELETGIAHHNGADSWSENKKRTKISYRGTGPPPDKFKEKVAEQSKEFFQEMCGGNRQTGRMKTNDGTVCYVRESPLNQRFFNPQRDFIRLHRDCFE